MVEGTMRRLHCGIDLGDATGGDGADLHGVGRIDDRDSGRPSDPLTIDEVTVVTVEELAGSLPEPGVIVACDGHDAGSLSPRGGVEHGTMLWGGWSAPHTRLR
ncbi:hypothetical protein D3C85_1148960 [compost metagenome]